MDLPSNEYNVAFNLKHTFADKLHSAPFPSRSEMPPKIETVCVTKTSKKKKSKKSKKPKSIADIQQSLSANCCACCCVLAAYMRESGKLVATCLGDKSGGKETRIAELFAELARAAGALGADIGRLLAYLWRLLVVINKDK